MNNEASSLRNSSFLCSVHLKQFSGRKLDKKATAEVQTANNSAPNSGAYRKCLLSKESLAGVSAAVSAIREYFYTMTLPWTNEGKRILPAKIHADFMARMTELGENYWNAVGTFIENYHSYREESRSLLGDLWIAEEYPGIDDLKKKYDFQVEIDPMPYVEDFRVDMSDDERAAIEKNIEQRLVAAQELAQANVWKRLLKVVKAMTEKLHDEKKPIFRDSLVSNIEQVVSMVPVLNVTGSKEINDMADRIKLELLSASPEDLRNDDTVKAEVAQKARNIYNELDFLLAPEQTFRKAA